MGRLHKRFNWKGRQVVKTVIDESEQNKIKVEIPEDTSHYDASNALVLPSTKRKTKKLRDKNAAPVKLLSKKQRKKLMKIAEKKLKNAKREELLEELKKFQAKPKDMAVLTSLQTVQTLGRKKYSKTSFETILPPSKVDPAEGTLKNLLRWRTPKAIKRELKLQAQSSKPKKMKRDYNIVQTDSSSCSSDEEGNDADHRPNGDVKATLTVNSHDNNFNDTCDANESSETKKVDKEIDLNVIENENLDTGVSEKSLCKTVKKVKTKGKLGLEVCKSEDKIVKKKKKKKKKISPVESSAEKVDKKDNVKLNEINEKKSDDDNNNNNNNNNNGKLQDATLEILNNNNKLITIVSETKTKSKEPRAFRIVKRDPEIQKHRLKLPILSEEHAVMEAINENPITIVVGPTGSGKTTQIPQFLYEAGYTSNGMKIGVTEPRRIAAISMAERVGYELNLPSNKVSYQIRYEGNSTPETEIKFMTDGVLFQELKNNHYLKGYSAIVMDEVHERTVHTDILLGLLSRIVLKRNEKGKPLKLIIMSATPRIEDFTQNSRLFHKGIPPIIQVPSRLYDVQIHFSKKTDPDYCEAAYKKVCSIHRLLPEGGILVFLTGQQEILELCKRLKETFPFKQNQNMKGEKMEKKKANGRRRSKMKIPEINLKDFVTKSPEKTRKTEHENDVPDEDIFSEEISQGFLAAKEQPLWVLPLYSLLPSFKQKRVFELPPSGTRLCVVATNVAETSLTIPNVKYVVDSGKTKEKIYDPVTGISSFHVTWTSKASATQRKGRAGRTSDGHCYCLYSSAVYNDELPQYTIPDIQKRPLDDVVLTMKALKIPVYMFPFPTQPNEEHLCESFKRLTVLGALEESQQLLEKQKSKGMKQMDITVITNSGLDMALLPMSPRFAKMVINCHQHPDIFPYVIIIISALTVREIFIEIPLAGKNLHPIHQSWGQQRSKWGGTGRSHLLGDLLVFINAFLEAEKREFSYQWCYENGLRHSALLECNKLRRQLTNEINLFFDKANITLTPNLKPPTEKQAYLIGEVVCMGSLDQIARKVSSSEFDNEADKKLWKNAYRTVYSDKPTFLSSSSVLYKDKPMYIMYQEIYESTKVYLRCATVVTEHWMLGHGGPLVDLSPPLDIPPPSYNSVLDKVMCYRKGTYGPKRWELKSNLVEFPLSVDLFNWVAYFFLIGELWTPLACFAKDLYDPKTLTSRITLMHREKRENLRRAFHVKDVRSASDLQREWMKDPNYLKKEYFDWIENENIKFTVNHMWPPIKESEYMFI